MPEYESRSINPDDEWDDLSPEIQQLFQDDPANWEATREQFRDQSMAMSLEPRVANAADVGIIAGAADALNLNRQITLEAVHQLRPDGNNILIPMLIHRWAQMEPAPVHMRCRVMLAMEGQPEDEAVNGWMDVPMDLFVQLKTVTERRIELGLPPKESGEGDWASFVQSFRAYVGSDDAAPGEDFPIL